ncbi:MAG: hypothetical protein KAS66_04215 [Candidatus Omnitrophica bacterium]|nr:hypothetical protein [Candidatus Omnitrophota bacterium]
MGKRVEAATKKLDTKKDNLVFRTPRADFSESSNSPADKFFFLQKTIGNQAVQRLIKSGHPLLQGKVRISQQGDKYKQEDDRIAEAVMQERMAVSLRTPHIQLACPLCEEDKLRWQPIEEEELQSQQIR